MRVFRERLPRQSKQRNPDGLWPARAAGLDVGDSPHKAAERNAGGRGKWPGPPQGRHSNITSGER